MYRFLSCTHQVESCIYRMFIACIVYWSWIYRAFIYLVRCRWWECSHSTCALRPWSLRRYIRQPKPLNPKPRRHKGVFFFFTTLQWYTSLRALNTRNRFTALQLPSLAEPNRALGIGSQNPIGPRHRPTAGMMPVVGVLTLDIVALVPEKVHPPL